MVFLFLSLLAALVDLAECSVPTQICLMGRGNNVYGSLSTAFASARDPRELMGTYSLTALSSTPSTLAVDFTAGIYEHKQFNSSSSNYIFKISNLGWVLTKGVLPTATEASQIKLTCFEDNILDCTNCSWFWGYDSAQYPIWPLTVSNGTCNTNMCMQNLSMSINTYDTSDLEVIGGSLQAVHVLPNETCQYDARVCDSGRTYWVNRDEPSLRWYYRTSQSNVINWVYGRDSSDRIACAPAYVESPMFCTIFVYASDRSGSVTKYTWRPGLCNESVDAEPVICPTLPPTAYPTSEPTSIPISSGDKHGISSVTSVLLAVGGGIVFVVAVILMIGYAKRSRKHAAFAAPAATQQQSTAMTAPSGQQAQATIGMTHQSGEYQVAPSTPPYAEMDAPMADEGDVPVTNC